MQRVRESWIEMKEAVAHGWQGFLKKPPAGMEKPAAPHTPVRRPSQNLSQTKKFLDGLPSTFIWPPVPIGWRLGAHFVVFVILEIDHAPNQA